MSREGLALLPPDLVGDICAFLPIHELQTLRSTGDSVLLQKIEYGVKEIEGKIFAFQQFPTWIFRCRHLRSLSITSPLARLLSPIDDAVLDFLPLEPLLELRFLNFTFLPAMRLLQGSSPSRNLKTLVPHLKSLTIAISSAFNVEWLQNLPSELEVLNISSADTRVKFTPQAISFLPKTLLELRMSVIDLFAPEEKDIFPPNLTSLFCHVNNASRLLSALPSTLQTLVCTFDSDTELRSSTFPQSITHLVFLTEVSPLVIDAPLPPSLTFFPVSRIFHCEIDREYLKLASHSDARLVPVVKSLESSSSTSTTPIPITLVYPPSITRVQVADRLSVKQLVAWFPNTKYWVCSDVVQDPGISLEEALEVIEKRKRSQTHDEEEESSLTPQLAHLHTYVRHMLPETDICNFHWSHVIPSTLTTLHCQGLRPGDQQLIMAAGIRLSALNILRAQNEVGHRLSFEFLEYLGRTLVQLDASASTLGYTDFFCSSSSSSSSSNAEHPIASFGPQFEALYLWWDSESDRLLKELFIRLPFPRSLMDLTIHVRSNHLGQTPFALYSDWSNFTRLRHMRIGLYSVHIEYKLEDLVGKLEFGSEEWNDLVKDKLATIPAEERDALSVRYESPGVHYKSFSTLPPSLKSLSCFLPINLSVETLKHLPRGLEEVEFYFAPWADLSSWTREHWQRLPPRIVELNIFVNLDAQLGPKNNPNFDRYSFTQWLPTGLFGLSLGSIKGKKTLETRAVRLEQRYLSEAFWNSK